ncbi:MAG: hypothetical protein WC869_15525 [Phycisphaerae bacterium]|jgi:hypothetical protein
MSTRTLIFAKGRRKYVFRYSVGCEGMVMDQLMQLAEDEGAGFDWLDAATMSLKVAQDALADGSALVRPAQEVRA